MSLRRLGPDDWAAFRALRVEMLTLAPESFGSTRAEWQDRPEAEVRAWLAGMLAFGSFDAAGGLVGCAAVARRPGSRAAHRGQVIAVYLRPEARGAGRMAALLDALAAAARGAGMLQLELEVADWNAAAIAAYRAAGYRICGRVPRAMHGPEGFTDDLVMVRALDDADLVAARGAPPAPDRAPRRDRGDA